MYILLYIKLGMNKTNFSYPQNIPIENYTKSVNIIKNLE